MQKKHEFKTTRTCKICGKEFLISNSNAKYCKGPHIRKCIICGKEFDFKNNLNKLTCSKKCSLNLNWQNKSEEMKNEIVKKRKATNFEKYGDENYCNIQQAKETYFKKSNDEKQLIREKFKQTCLEKYGVDNPYKDTERMKKAYQEKLGVDNPGQSVIVKEKIKQTFLKNYGVDHPFKLKRISDKCKNNYDGKYWNQIQYDDFTYNILIDKNAMISFLKSFEFKDRTYSTLLQHVNCSFITLNRAILKFELSNLINHYRSYFEQDVYNYVKSICEYNIVTGDKSTLNGQELDIYIPELKLAIECNGTYWHSSICKDKNYHYNKSRLCEEKGIRLIHIWEYEWENERQRSILENIILSACGNIQNKIYARNCKIEIRESKLMKQFFEENNIQGFRGGKFAICLLYNNEVVMSYIMGKAFFGKGKYEWEVIRGATKLGCTIIGGASKIWKYFKDNYNPRSCVYYVDYNYFNGKSIQYLDNFKFVKAQSSFKNWWIKDNVIKNRDPSHHKEIKEFEKEGLVIPIYNAGTKVYVWENLK